MTMHTSQHLLSAVLEDRLNIQTLSWSLTDAPAPCYVELARSMTSDEIQSIQTTANRYVFEGRNVHVEVQEMEKPNEPEKLEDHARGFSKAIPTDYTGGIMRVVVIDQIDRNPCVINTLLEMIAPMELTVQLLRHSLAQFAQSSTLFSPSNRDSCSFDHHFR